jgi:TusA-related sulfurtransferase
MTLNEYKSGDQIEALITNPQTNKEVWVDAEVLDKRMVYPNHGERFKPYPFLIVRLKRTYCKASSLQMD